jgi:ABC-type multidrug transport system fused ATPase/permease subunit
VYYFFFPFFFPYRCVFLFGYTQQRLVRALRIDLFRSLLQQDIAFFDAAATGNISSRLTSDCAGLFTLNPKP